MTDVPTALAGRTRVGAKALRAVATAVTAEALGVDARDVTVVLADDDGLLGVSATSAIALPSLAGTQRPTTTALDRAAETRSTVRDRMLALTGSTVGIVNLRLTTARITTTAHTRVDRRTR
jgi:hypothetical protein